MQVKNIRSIKFLPILFGIAALGSILFFLMYTRHFTFNDPKVVLKENGFSPSTITVRLGQTVVFTNNTNQEFWPASDFHPTHALYPEFDPKQPVSAHESWSFTFTKPGKWTYHDHLNPTHVGTIVVQDAQGKMADAVPCANAASVECWNYQISEALTTGGVDAAFTELDTLYKTYPAFAQSCHSFAHTLGEAAYRQYNETKKADLSAKSNYCGYGFYHGFMETLLHTTGDVQQAQDFCKYVGDQLQAETSDAEGACYHGIGHGAVDGGDQRAWGNAQSFIEPGIQLCEQVAGNDRTEFGKLYRCVTGAYNAVEILSQDPKYKLEIISTNPFYLCPSQPVAFQEGCYTNMLPAVFRMTNNNIGSSLQYVLSKVPTTAGTNTILQTVVQNLFYESIRMHLMDSDFGVTESVGLCRNLKDSSLHDSCIAGLAGGHMQYGEPQRQYIKALAFCGNKMLTGHEQDVCYGHVLVRLRIWYTESKKQEICNSAPADYKHYCLN